MASELDGLTEQIIAAAIAVHHEIGPGALESAYEACLDFELQDRKLAVERQVPFPLVYRGRRLNCGYRVDMIVEDKVVVELSGRTVGLLFNFHVKWFVDGGIRRIVHNHAETGISQ